MTKTTTISLGDRTITAGPVFDVLLSAIPDLAADIEAMTRGETITRDFDTMKVEVVRDHLMPLEVGVTVNEDLSIHVECHDEGVQESIWMATERQSVAYALQDVLEARFEAVEPIGDAFALPTSLQVVTGMTMTDVDYTPPMGGDGLHMVFAAW